MCGVFKPVTDYYHYPGRNGVMGVCKPCCIRLAVKYKRQRKLRKRLADRSNAPVVAEALMEEK